MLIVSHVTWTAAAAAAAADVTACNDEM